MKTNIARFTRALPLVILLLSAMVLAAVAGGTVSFVHYSVSADETQATFFYTVTNQGSPDVSRVLLGVWPCVTVVEAGTWSDGYMTEPGGGEASIGCIASTYMCGAIFDEGIHDEGEVANYYFTIDLGSAGPDGFLINDNGVNTFIESGGHSETSTVRGPVCIPTSVTVGSMNATAAGMPVAALGSLALLGLGALAAFRRRSA